MNGPISAHTAARASWSTSRKRYSYRRWKFKPGRVPRRATPLGSGRGAGPAKLFAMAVAFSPPAAGGSRVRKLLALGGFALLGAAVVKELRMPARKRQW